MKKLFKKIIKNQIETEKYLIRVRKERLKNERKDTKQIHENDENTKS
ncbi:MAG: hypothetical protein ACRCX8_00150 [Sarcina sp.]